MHSERFDIIGGATIKDFLENQVLSIIVVSLVFWSLFIITYYNVFKTKYL